MNGMDAALAALSVVAHLDNVLALALGVVIGVIVGAIPGMSATMAVALSLPFTFTLDPIVGILMLLGVYKGGIYGGSIPAILIRTPGTPASSCTVLDGHPLASRGQAGKALEMSLYASCIADVISNLSLILFAAWLAAFALSFGPPEFFTLILFSLTIIAGVAGDTLMKGLIAAGLGLLLATIGLDLVYGTDRFIFGQADMMSGLNFIPVLIGLFAIPEILLQCSSSPDDEGKMVALGHSHATMADMRRCLKSILRGSVIGVIMGAIPGIGGAPSAFMSYGAARRASPDGDNFGKGELEGVAAAEAGNNGVCGATMIPLLALGVPGDVITAVILGAFMVHGLQPGPLLFQQNIVMIYSIFIGIMLSSVFLLIVGLVAIRIFRHVADIPKSILMPSVLALCVFGTYAVNNTMFDVLVMFATGLLGYGMIRLGMPVAPFLIAFILGPMLEDNFRQAMLMGRSDFVIFFRSPITWFFWSLTLLSVGMMIWRGVRPMPAEVN
ncbi:MAG: tripartite tricarboxylate transporter permease [Geminicoccaceae bacterium]|nr:tripartite tricarboxylate transporter permease [Geminicoccaceae bacterium]